MPYPLSAVRMPESGFASAEDTCTGMVLGRALGSLSPADLIGLDTLTAIADALYTEFKDPPRAAPPPRLRAVGAGLLGRTSGRGFHGSAPTPS